MEAWSSEFKKALRGAETGLGSVAVADEVELVLGVSDNFVNAGTDVAAGTAGLVAFLICYSPSLVEWFAFTPHLRDQKASS
jgi:hypothetical protein